jgi:hypothetical protein
MLSPNSRKSPPSVHLSPSIAAPLSLRHEYQNKGEPFNEAAARDMFTRELTVLTHPS